MGLLAVAAGAYDLSIDATSLGLFEGMPKHVEKLSGISHKGHLFGDHTIEIVDTGIEAMFILFTVKEWSDIVKELIWPWSATMGETPVPFKLASDYRAVEIVATAEAGTKAATLGPVTRTYGQAVLANAQQIEHMLGGGERNIPVVMQILPTAESVGSHELVYYIDT